MGLGQGGKIDCDEADKEAVQAEQELLQEIRRLRDTAPAVIEAWAARHIDSTELALEKERSESSRQGFEQLLGEWREVAAGTREVVTLRLAYWFISDPP